MLVQGLVKARSDAMDGDSDGAMMALPWLRWTNELTTAVVLQTLGAWLLAVCLGRCRVVHCTSSLHGQAGSSSDSRGTCSESLTEWEQT
jgi:hypothetical protein